MSYRRYSDEQTKLVEQWYCDNFFTDVLCGMEDKQTIFRIVEKRPDGYTPSVRAKLNRIRDNWIAYNKP